MASPQPTEVVGRAERLSSADSPSAGTITASPRTASRRKSFGRSLSISMSAEDEVDSSGVPTSLFSQAKTMERKDSSPHLVPLTPRSALMSNVASLLGNGILSIGKEGTSTAAGPPQSQADLRKAVDEWKKDFEAQAEEKFGWVPKTRSSAALSQSCNIGNSISRPGNRPSSMGTSRDQGFVENSGRPALGLLDDFHAYIGHMDKNEAERKAQTLQRHFRGYKARKDMGSIVLDRFCEEGGMENISDGEVDVTNILDDDDREGSRYARGLSESSGVPKASDSISRIERRGRSTVLVDSSSAEISAACKVPRENLEAMTDADLASFKEKLSDMIYVVSQNLVEVLEEREDSKLEKEIRLFLISELLGKTSAGGGCSPIGQPPKELAQHRRRMSDISWALRKSPAMKPSGPPGVSPSVSPAIHSRTGRPVGRLALASPNMRPSGRKPKSHPPPEVVKDVQEVESIQSLD